MKEIMRAPRGTQDILPGQTEQWRAVEALALRIAQHYGFSEIRTPLIESTSLFTRSVGETTDVVQKEMFTFQDRGGRTLSLRPEGTAGVLRAAIERGLLARALPLKLCYLFPCFRNERPQAGRFKQFYQFGAELIGSKSPLADVELIALVSRIFASLGVQGLQLQINSIGCRHCRADYHRALKAYFAAREEDLCVRCKQRLQSNPLRLLDCKDPGCAQLSQEAPSILDYLCTKCVDHFTAVQRQLTDLGIVYTVNPRIVRGLDYYTKTVFEFLSDDLGAQSAVCGGGRYDHLVEELGGPSLGALGFALGMERLLLILEKQDIQLGSPLPCHIYLASVGEEANRRAFHLCQQVRDSGLHPEVDLMGRSVKAQMKYANKIGALYAGVLGEEELERGQILLKRMCDGQTHAVPLSELPARLHALLQAEP